MLEPKGKRRRKGRVKGTRLPTKVYRSYTAADLRICMLVELTELCWMGREEWRGQSEI